MGAVLKLREVWHGIFRSFTGRSLVFACLVRPCRNFLFVNYFSSTSKLSSFNCITGDLQIISSRVNCVFPTRGEEVDITPGLDALSIRFPRQCRDY